MYIKYIPHDTSVELRILTLIADESYQLCPKYLGIIDRDISELEPIIKFFWRVMFVNTTTELRIAGDRDYMLQCIIYKPLQVRLYFM